MIDVHRRATNFNHLVIADCFSKTKIKQYRNTPFSYTYMYAI